MFSVIFYQIQYLTWLIIFLTVLSRVKCDMYRIGVGIFDITGPAVETGMTGYPGANTQGIHFRLYSRAAVIEDSDGNRVCFVSADVTMISQIVKLEVIRILESKYPGVYSINNVMLSSTHTHPAPGGYLQYFLYDIPTLGFIKQNFEAVRDGIISSIDRAHNNLTYGYIYINNGELLDASINRSPTAYLNNKKEERDRYQYNTDKNMTVLKLTDQNGNGLGVISWFAVHATSMNNTNKLISGDNKGYASMLFEQDINGGTLHGKGPFVALFPQSNEGDVSPNINGPHCLDTGLPCDIATSTCDGNVMNCVASGPGKDMFESTKIIGFRQFFKAKELYTSAITELSGNIKYIHQTIDMSNTLVKLKNNTIVRTCAAALGYSFAAGTIDGPGSFGFFQGATSSSPIFNLIRDIIKKPSPNLLECQYPKPILLATGEINLPYPWQPAILPTQIFQIGQLLIVAVPGEFTTMSGRRVREAVKREFKRQKFNSTVEVVISGLSNAYSSYVTTYEEYQVQRYEGASTIFGPHTLDAYIQQYKKLTKYLATEQQLETGPPEPNLLNQQLSLQPGVLCDRAPFDKKFGDVLIDANNSYTLGSKVIVVFVSGNPRNNLRIEDTFLKVEKINGNTGQWDVIATDANWETRFLWNPTNDLLAESQATIIWDIPLDSMPGKYRIRHFGDSRNLMTGIKSYVGSSKIFEVK